QNEIHPYYQENDVIPYIQSLGIVVQGWYLLGGNKAGIETEMVQLSGKIIEPCKACRACGGRKNCVHKKDMFQEIFEKMIQADDIILGSPVYTANISANMQAFLEQASVVTDMNKSDNLLQHKVGAAVTAARRGGNAGNKRTVGYSRL
ncbi:MAG: NAD(P)H-dependent oxidoreductase, partial [Bacteroides fragilis]|nr:NAD(P)H-dependent oxidoreductase [Bacteroides fragilis]